MEERVRALEERMAALVGVAGVPGWVPRIEAEQARSAAAQGKRLEELRTWTAEELATLKAETAITRGTATETKIRIATVVGVVLFAVAVATFALRMLTWAGN